MTSMVLVLAHGIDAESLENQCVYDSCYDFIGWLGGVIDEDGGHPCEFMRLADDGYPACHSATEVARLRGENARLRKLVRDLHECLRHQECDESCPHCDEDSAWDVVDVGGGVMEPYYTSCCTVGLEGCEDPICSTDTLLRDRGIEVE